LNYINFIYRKNESKPFNRKLILEINSSKTLGELWNASRKMRKFVDEFAKRYAADEAKQVANELYKIEIERHNNLLKWK
jgi:hypothetical protein